MLGNKPAPGTLEEVRAAHGETFSLNYLTKLRPSERLAYVQEHLPEIAQLTQKQLDRVGTLLCHASSKEVREAYKIIGDLRSDRAQEVFEDNLGTKGPLGARQIAIGKANGKK